MPAGRVCFSLALIATCSACRTDHSTSLVPSSIPTRVTWELTRVASVTGETRFAPERGQSYTIRFDDDGTVHGCNACNACTGTYSYLPAQQILIHFSCTEAGCGSPSPWLGYNEVISRTTSFTLTDGALVLTCTDRSGERLQLVHRRAE